MRARPSLARQVTVGLVVYGILLTAAVFAHGLLVNEHAERRVWQAMLDTEMTELLERRERDPEFNWSNDGRLDLYVLDSAPAKSMAPSALQRLAPGLHDSVIFDGSEWVVLVRRSDGVRHALALDIEGFEADEWTLAMPVLLSSALFMLLLSIAVHFGGRVFARPLRDFAARIGALDPDQRGLRVDVPARASSELAVIAGALNGYLERNDRYVDRERDFLDTASHELRTPLAVIRSATQVALAADASATATRRQLEQIARTTREVEELMLMLLVLAKDPARAHATSDRVRLDTLLPAVVEAHRYLAEGKDLLLVLEPMAPVSLVAPDAVVRMAVANLVRNAIEHSDRGTIRVGIEGDGVAIHDPGHGMSPEDISALYARQARRGDRSAGIGLALVARVCEHLGWQFDIVAAPSGGTVARLDFGRGVLRQNSDPG